MKTKGFFWHIHHDKLVEWSDDIDERIAYIESDKPENEQALRLKLMKPVRGRLPAKFAKAWECHLSFNDSSRLVVRFFANNSEDTMIVFDKEQTKRLINFIRLMK